MQGDSPTTVAAQLRRGVPGRPNITTLESFKTTLLRANAIAFMPSTTGIYLTMKVFPRLGIADGMAKKSKTTQYMSMFSAAAVAGFRQSDASKRLIAFLASDRSTEAIQTSGMERPKRR